MLKNTEINVDKDVARFYRIEKRFDKFISEKVKAMSDTEKSSYSAKHGGVKRQMTDDEIHAFESMSNVDKWHEIQLEEISREEKI